MGNAGRPVDRSVVGWLVGWLWEMQEGKEDSDWLVGWLDHAQERGDEWVAYTSCLLPTRPLPPPAPWPLPCCCAPGEPATRAEAWRALEDCQQQGLVRSIGVSNFGVGHLEKLLRTARVVPAVNQVRWPASSYHTLPSRLAPPRCHTLNPPPITPYPPTYNTLPAHL